jgi:hypothetical protein
VRTRLAIVVAIATFALAAARVALAEIPPTQVSPDDGAAFIAQPGQITFQASTASPGPTYMDFYVSRDTPQFDSNGVISNWIDHVHGLGSGNPPLYAAGPNPDEVWPTRPGTYYWQAVYYDCTTGPPDCFNESPIRTLTINPRPASTAGPGNEPNTFLTRRPRHRTHKRKVTFAFSSDVAGAHFRCLYAEGWSHCRSPHTFRHLKPGRYKFKAQAVVNGVKDPTPALWVFKVLR